MLVAIDDFDIEVARSRANPNLMKLLDARAQGFQTAILQAAAEGVGVYTRVGFQPFGNIIEYKPPISEPRNT